MTERTTDEATAAARAAYDAYLDTRARIHAGDESWAALADHFTDDAVFVDPVWGRMEGAEAIRRFMIESMGGLEDWSFPEVWTVVEGDRVVSAWQNRLPGERADGSPYETLGISVLTHAGDGRFDSEHDFLNMAHVAELVGESGWRPPAGFNPPPAHPRR